MRGKKSLREDYDTDECLHSPPQTIDDNGLYHH